MMDGPEDRNGTDLCIVMQFEELAGLTGWVPPLRLIVGGPCIPPTGP